MYVPAAGARDVRTALEETVLVVDVDPGTGVLSVDPAAVATRAGKRPVLVELEVVP